MREYLLLQTWNHISIYFLVYAKFYEKVLIMFYGRFIIRKEYKDIDELSQLRLLVILPSSDGKVFAMKAYNLYR